MCRDSVIFNSTFRKTNETNLPQGLPQPPHKVHQGFWGGWEIMNQLQDLCSRMCSIIGICYFLHKSLHFDRIFKCDIKLKLRVDLLSFLHFWPAPNSSRDLLSLRQKGSNLWTLTTTKKRFSPLVLDSLRQKDTLQALSPVWEQYSSKGRSKDLILNRWPPSPHRSFRISLCHFFGQPDLVLLIGMCVV